MLDVRRLQVLGEVARRGSFSAAADALYLSQSAVSQQVASLEKEVGLPLLERTPEGPKPTDAGRLLIDHGDAAIARLDEAERDLAAIAGLEGGEVRIASFPSATGGLLMDALREFSAALPGGGPLGHRGRAGELASVTARRRHRYRDRVRLPGPLPRVRGPRHRARAAAHRVDVPRASERPPPGVEGHGAHRRALRRAVAVRRAAELLRRGDRRRLQGGRLRAADRVRERGVPRAPGLRGRGPRRDPAARPRAAHARSRTSSSSRRRRRPSSAASGRRCARRARARPRPRR